MREILFRGKRIDNGEWVEGYLYVTHNGEYEIGSYNAEVKIERWTHEVDPSSVGQCVSLTDKNGKRIFEGDILKHDIECYCVVKYGEFNCSCCDGVYGWYFDGGDIRNVDYYEVCGNIHDNPELIGENDATD